MLCKEGKLDEALSIFKDRPDAAGAASLIAAIGYKQRHDIEAAFSVYNRLKESSSGGTTPSLATFRALLLACCKTKGNTSRALPLWHEMQQQSVHPDGITFGLFCLACSEAAEQGDVELAVKVAETIFAQARDHKGTGPSLTAIDCAQLIKTFTHGPESFRLALDLEEWMEWQCIPLNTHAWVSLVR